MREIGQYLLISRSTFDHRKWILELRKLLPALASALAGLFPGAAGDLSLFFPEYPVTGK